MEPRCETAISLSLCRCLARVPHLGARIRGPDCARSRLGQIQETLTRYRVLGYLTRAHRRSGTYAFIGRLLIDCGIIPRLHDRYAVGGQAATPSGSGSSGSSSARRFRPLVALAAVG